MVILVGRNEAKIAKPLPSLQASLSGKLGPYPSRVIREALVLHRKGDQLFLTYHKPTAFAGGQMTLAALKADLRSRAAGNMLKQMSPSRKEPLK